MKIRSGSATLIITATILILSACTGNHQSEKLETIDSLNMVMDEAELIFDEINIDSLGMILSVFKDKSEEIKKYYSKESEEGWKVITRYTDLKKPLRNVVEYYDDIKEELQYSRQQLDSLAYDLKNNVITGELATKYLYEEEKAVGTLHKIISNNLITSKVIMHDFDSLNTLVEEIIEEIKKSEDGREKTEEGEK